jgi:DNA-binding NtrC family response regulator
MEMVHFIPSSQRRIAVLAAQADSAPVMIFGGSGTGKGAIARWIHANGPRVASTFLVASHKKSLAEQILNAHGGTLMIPEIGECPLAEQKVLLGYLKTRSIPHPEERRMSALANTRVIVTTSHALEGRAQGGLFNIELLEKLNVFRIEMPALSKRTDEFEDIVMGITGEITRELHKEHVRALNSETWSLIRSYEWPGNIRELRNVLRVAVAACKGDVIEVNDLPDFRYARIDFHATREEFEKTYILELLKSFEWEIDKTCLMTRIDKDTLISKIKHYGISMETSSP